MSFLREKPYDPVGATFGGGQAPFSDVWNSARDIAVYADNFNAEEMAFEEAINRRIDAVMSATGVAVKNPYYDTRRPGLPRGAVDYLRSQNMPEFYRSLATLEQRYPDQARVIRAGVPIEEDAKLVARQAEERFGRVLASRQDTAGKWTAMLGGSLAGSFRDPVQVATLIAGGGPGAARTISGRILGVTVKEMAINGATEAAMQPKVQAWREKAGLPHGVTEAVRNVTLAAVLGGAFGGLVQGVVEGLGRLGFKGRALDSASAQASQAAEPGSPMARALNESPEAAQEVLEPIRDALAPEARGALDARAADRPGDEARQADAIAFAEDPQSGRVSFDDVRSELTGDLGARPSGRQPQSLLGFLASEGGLRLDGDLSAMNAERWFGQGGRLVRKEGGLSLDEARRRAVAAGYLDDTAFEGGVSTSTVDDLLAAIGDELAGTKLYSRHDGDAGELARLQRAYDDNLATIDRSIAALQNVTTDELPAEIKRRAAELMIRGDADAETALERAIMEDYYTGEPERALTYDDGNEIPFSTDDRPGGAQQRGDVAPAGTGAGRPGERSLAEDGAEPGAPGEAQGRPAEPAGGVDDPVSPEEAKLTDEMLKELDPDGSIADSFDLGAELKAEAEEISKLATFLTHCKVGA